MAGWLSVPSEALNGEPATEPPSHPATGIFSQVVRVKHWRGPMVMLGIIAVLGVIVRVYERGPIRQNPVVWDFDPKDASVIEIECPKSPEGMVLKRDASTWKMTKPVQTRADQQAIQALLDAVKLVEQTGSEFNSSDMKKYGLDKPSAQLTVELKGGTTEKLFLGSKLPDNASVYALRPGTQRVMVVQGSVQDAVSKSPDDLRDRTALRFDTDSLSGVTIAYEKKDFQIDREGQTQWTLLHPIKAAADSVTMDGYINRIKDLKATKFITEKAESLKKYGLDAPQVKIELQRTGKSPIALLVGAKAKEDPTAVYAKASDQPQVFLLSDSILTELKKGLHDLRGKNVLDFETEKVRRLEIASASTIDLNRTGLGDASTWTLKAPAEASADKTAVDTLLSSLKNLRADEFIDHPKSDAEYGIDRPQAKLSIWLEGGKAPYRTLLIGKKSASPEGLFVKVAGEPTVYRVPAMNDKDLKPSVARLHERSITSFNRDNAEQITLKRPGEKTIVLEKAGKEDWKITSPEKVDANNTVQTLLFTLSDLRGDEWVEDNPKDLKTYGLDKPRLEVEIKVKGKPTQSFAVGQTVKKPEGNKAYVMTKGKTRAVFLKLETGMTDLFKDMADLRKAS